jgi:flagellar protein FlgJ
MPESAAQASRKSDRLQAADDFPESRSATVAINPPSDILSDVAAAAHPAKLREATRRLETAGAEAAAAAGFASALSTAGAGKAAEAAAAAASLPSGTTKPVAAPLPKPTEQEALKKFEAFFLQTFVDSVLPKGSEAVFGAGTAGEVWRSMLAEQIAAEIAKGSSFGIAERIAGSHFNTAQQQQPSLTQPKTEPGENNLSYVKSRGKSEGLTGLSPTPASMILGTRS